MQVKDLMSMQSIMALLITGYCLHLTIENLSPTATSPTITSIATPLFASSDSLVERNSQYSIASQFNRLSFENESLQFKIRELLQSSQFRQAQTLLLEMAAKSVEQNDKTKLISVMLLLGEVASAEQELEKAEVYLMEALDIAILAGDGKAKAQSYQQLGKLHIKTREVARTAGNAYDDLWLIRRQIQQGQYRDISQNLQQVIDTNISIRRFGAAASAYETMAEYYHLFNDDYLSLQAASEAAKLYASSGRLDRSREILSTFRLDQINSVQVTAVSDEVNHLFQQYQLDVAQSAQAKHYQMLYHHYLNQGETQRAWNLRIQASKSNSKVSTRLMYQRQADVIAILYNSNFAMDKARTYLQQASNLFATQGEEEMYADTQWMKSLIY